MAAERRADLVGWSNVTAKLSSTPSYKDGEYTNYIFEVWGQGEPMLEDSETEKKTPSTTSNESMAAKTISKGPLESNP